MTNRGGMGMKKHGQSGHSPNQNHFHGKTSGKRVNRKGKGKNKKQRKKNRGTHVNKYAQSK